MKYLKKFEMRDSFIQEGPHKTNQNPNIKNNIDRLEKYIYDEKRQVYLVVVGNKNSRISELDNVIYMSSIEFSKILNKKLNYSNQLVILVEDDTFYNLPTPTLNKCALVIVDKIPEDIIDKVEIISMK